MASRLQTSLVILSVSGALLIGLARRRLRRGRCLSSKPQEVQRVSCRGGKLSTSRPCVYVRTPLGGCEDRWTDDYLETVVGDLKVSAHVSETPNLDFATKNFAYEVMPFREFLSRARGEEKQYLYYRSQHVKRNKPSSLETIGPLGEEFKLPQQLLEGFDVHSTVLRAATPGLRMWLHYDVCDNYLCCVRGRKRVALLSPQHIGNLYIASSSSAMGSRVLHESEQLWQEYPLAEAAWARRLEVVLEEGDVLFIPAFWPHCTEALPANGANAKRASISVNTFLLRPENQRLHDPRDIWANRELLPAQEALKAFEEKTVPALNKLPDVPRSFYCRKLAAVLLAVAEEAEQRKDA